MSFIDKVKVSAFAGKGGDGKLSFRHEKFVDKGGPDGGDGGDGGNVVLVASRNQNTLVAFRYQKELKADPGRGGDKVRKHGRSAKHLMVAVPVGTIATNEKGIIVADLVEDGQQEIVAKGGKGGFGNAHFVSSRRQTPKFAEKGEPGEEFELQLELKIIADVGLVGLPNAGKSTLLSRVSNARPEIADYPFTTLTPNLGVVDIDNDTSVLLADIPGLIEGAADGKGLGHDFLRHIERTAAILHLIDAYQDDIPGTYTTVREELKAYDAKMAKRPEIVALTKVEGLDQEIIDDLLAQLRTVVPARTPVFAISAQSAQGLKELLYKVKAVVDKERAKKPIKTPESDIPVLRILDNSKAWHVTKEGKQFVVTGTTIERFASRTDFENEESVQRLRTIMRKQGIMHELIRQGVEAEDSIRIGRGIMSY